MPADVLNLAGQFGPMGLLVAYLMWRDLRTDKLARERVETDKALAAAMAILTATIQGLK